MHLGRNGRKEKLRATSARMPESSAFLNPEAARICALEHRPRQSCVGRLGRRRGARALLRVVPTGREFRHGQRCCSACYCGGRSADATTTSAFAGSGSVARELVRATFAPVRSSYMKLWITPSIEVGSQRRLISTASPLCAPPSYERADWVVRRFHGCRSAWVANPNGRSVADGPRGWEYWCPAPPPSPRGWPAWDLPPRDKRLPLSLRRPPLGRAGRWRRRLRRLSRRRGYRPSARAFPATSARGTA